MLDSAYLVLYTIKITVEAQIKPITTRPAIIPPAITPGWSVVAMPVEHEFSRNNINKALAGYSTIL